MDIAFISGCGNSSRVLVREGDVYHAGCFSGSKERLIAAIKGKYIGSNAEKYIDKVEQLSKMKLQDFQDIHAENDCALRWAAEKGHIEIVKYLVSKGANIHAENDCALRWVAEKGHLDVVKHLVSQGADIHAENDFALRWAAANGHLDVVKYLVSKGANIHAKDDFALSWAARNGHLDVVKYLKSL